MAAGLDTGKVEPDSTYIDEGEVKVGPYTIRNSDLQTYGAQTMTQVLENSLNTGMVFVIKRVPPGVWREYLENFGLGEPTGIDLVGEIGGNLQNVRSRGEVEIATSAFGQGIAVTPIGLISAIGAIANQGEWIEPSLVEKISFSDKREEAADSPRKKRVVSKETAETVTGMMVSVVDNGFGRHAGVTGYSVAGKTGTAQIPSPTGGYSDDTIHSFIGFAPAFDPVFVMLIRIDRPKVDRFSDRTAAPVFGKVAEFILHYYNIEPDRPILD
ncbi:hypothetical protein IID20_04510 [Patescibacteria group bacterium]|nr:hypothetical protein [Patescibacteria group bacterium]